MERKKIALYLVLVYDDYSVRQELAGVQLIFFSKKERFLPPRLTPSSESRVAACGAHRPHFLLGIDRWFPNSTLTVCANLLLATIPAPLLKRYLYVVLVVDPVNVHVTPMEILGRSLGLDSPYETLESNLEFYAPPISTVPRARPKVRAPFFELASESNLDHEFGMVAVHTDMLSLFLPFRGPRMNDELHWAALAAVFWTVAKATHGGRLFLLNSVVAEVDRRRNVFARIHGHVTNNSIAHGTAMRRAQDAAFYWVSTALSSTEAMRSILGILFDFFFFAVCLT